MSPEEINAILNLEPEELAITMLKDIMAHVDSRFTKDSFICEPLIKSGRLSR